MLIANVLLIQIVIRTIIIQKELPIAIHYI